MKQRVVVQAVIRQEDKVLLLRRVAGRPELVGSYELPGGRLDAHEQPDDAVKRYIKASVGLDVQQLRLNDVLAMENEDDGNIQHLLILYSIDASLASGKIQLGHSYDDYVWQELSLTQQLRLRDSTSLMLKLLQRTIDVPSTDDKVKKQQSIKDDDLHVIIYSDGGSRGNPGPSAAAFVIENDDQVVIDEGGEYIGITTNNQAEYHGVQLGLERARVLGVRTIDFRTDSLMVVNQMKGVYMIKNRDLWPINERIIELVSYFDGVTFTHIDRELNVRADTLVNEVLDQHRDDIV